MKKQGQPKSSINKSEQVLRWLTKRGMAYAWRLNKVTGSHDLRIVVFDDERLFNMFNTAYDVPVEVVNRGLAAVKQHLAAHERERAQRRLKEAKVNLANAKKMVLNCANWLND